MRGVRTVILMAIIVSPALLCEQASAQTRGFVVEITNAGTGSDPDSAWESCVGGSLNIEIAPAEWVGRGYVIEQPERPTAQADQATYPWRDEYLDGRSSLAGWLRAWIYDDGGTDKDFRLGYYSSAGTTGNDNLTSIFLTTAVDAGCYGAQFADMMVHPGMIAPGDGLTFGWEVLATPIRSTGWHEWRIEYAYDWDLAEVAFYIDDMTSPAYTLWYTSDHPAWASANDMTDISLGAPDPHLGAVWADDVTAMTTMVTPEPATLALLALGGMGVLGRAVRRRRAR